MRRVVVVVLSACLAACQTGPAGPEPPTPPSSQPTPNPTPGPLSGRWVGPTAEDMGIITHQEVRFHDCGRNCVDYCRTFYNVDEATLSHQGTRLTGAMILSFAGAECRSGSVVTRVPASFGGDDRPTHYLEMTVTPSGGASIAWADAGGFAGPDFPVTHDLVGTHTPSSITVSGERTLEGRPATQTWSVTYRLRRP